MECVSVYYTHVFILFDFVPPKCRDTFSVESFNHMMLTYVPKRIHFSTCTFNMRMNLAVLDWVRLIVL